MVQDRSRGGERWRSAAGAIALLCGGLGCGGNSLAGAVGSGPDPCPDPSQELPGTFDAGCDFSAELNPGGAWAYGWSPRSDLSPEGFVRAGHADAGGPIGVWSPSAADPYPYVACNRTGRARVDGSGSWAVRPRQLALEAAADGRYGVLRFTAPGPGLYAVGARFEGVHFGGSTTDVHVLLDGASLLDAAIEGYGGDPEFHAVDHPVPEIGSPWADYAGLLQLAEGQVIDFAVGTGRDGRHVDDTTGLQVHVAQLP